MKTNVQSVINRPRPETQQEWYFFIKDSVIAGDGYIHIPDDNGNPNREWSIFDNDKIESTAKMCEICPALADKIYNELSDQLEQVEAMIAEKYATER